MLTVEEPEKQLNTEVTDSLPPPTSESEAEQTEQPQNRSEQEQEHGDAQSPKRKYPATLQLLPVEEEVAQEIQTKLSEDNIELIRKVLAVMGSEKARKLVTKSFEIEEKGGIAVQDGSRRRTLGGVFFFLVRGRVSPTQHRYLWPEHPRWANYVPPEKSEESQKASQKPRPRPSPEQRDGGGREQQGSGYRNNQQGGGYRNQQGGGYRNNQQGGGYRDQQGGGYRDQQGGGYRNQQGGGYRNQRGDSYQDQRGAYTPQSNYSRPIYFSWEERVDVFAEFNSEFGEARTVQLKIIGRPQRVITRNQVVFVTMTNPGNPPPLPKGIPVPKEDKTVYLVMIADKQWQKVSTALEQDAGDRLIIQGYPVFDQKLGTITVLAQSVTTIGLERAKQSPD